MSEPPDPAEYVAVEVAGKVTGISSRTLRYWIRTGKLPAVTGKRGKLVRLDDVGQVAALAGRPIGNDHGPASTAADLASDQAEDLAGTAAVTTTAAQQLAAIRDEWLQPLVEKIGTLERENGRLEAERDQAARERDELRAEVERLHAEAASRQALPATASASEPAQPEQPRRRWWQVWR